MGSQNITYLGQNKTNELTSSQILLTEVKQYTVLAIIIIGVVTNFLTMVVVCGKKFRQKSVSVYMFTLALVDSGFLIARLLTFSIPYFVGYDITTEDPISCKLLFYLIYIFGTLSSWTIGKFYPFRITKHVIAGQTRLIRSH